MLSNIKIALGLIGLFIGCGAGAVSTNPLRSTASEREPQPAATPQTQQSDYALQGDYPPEPGAPHVPVHASVSSYRRAGATYDAPPPTPSRRGSATPVDRQHADIPPEVAASTGPRGTSGEAQRYDTVGYASWYGEEMQGSRTASGQKFVPSAISAAHRTVPLGSIVEVTALDTGRTILVLVNDRGPGQRNLEIDLSRGAAQLLGVNATAPVRVRLVSASPPDQMALRSGHAASPRIDAPQALLIALRHKLPPRTAPVPTPKPRPGRAARPMADVPVAREAPKPGSVAAPQIARAPMIESPNRATSGLFVQVAALSNEAKAKALATQLRGRVQRVGAIYRIQVGPFANTTSAKAARDDVARRGYGDARIVQTN
jgi:rare lipoprotein A